MIEVSTLPAILTQKTIDQIVGERYAQDDQWGGPDHDDMHAPIDWIGFIMEQIDKLSIEGPGPRQALHGDAVLVRARLVKIAALAVAGMQSIDRVLAYEAAHPPQPAESPMREALERASQANAAALPTTETPQ